VWLRSLGSMVMVLCCDVQRDVGWVVGKESVDVNSNCRCRMCNIGGYEKGGQ
jgi:hypothetical protein